MKKLFLLLAAAGITLSAAADEGMWLLPYLKKMNIKDMRAKGCKLSADDIYSADKASLKDAIVIFGGGCTGEIVSPDGLLFTNHHCGYSSIQKLSSVDHDYLADGFWAENREGELPAPGLAVRFVRHIIDVTPEIVGNIPSIAGEREYAEIADANKKAVIERLEEQYPGMEVIIPGFFGNNQFFAFVYEVYTDVRLVGTPPSSIGKFGGDIDNWMWPRHTGDFSIFRVYAGKDNRPAAYSKENVPYKAEKWLDISLKGIDEGDFAMIMGFPGSTQRYMTSYEIDNMLGVSNPQRIFIRGERQKILRSFMDRDQAIRIQYAAKYAQSSNYWKNSIGMSRGIEKLDVKSKKQEQEQAFAAWAAANTLPEEHYVEALPLIESYCAETREPSGKMQYVSEALFGAIELISAASYADQLSEVEMQDRHRNFLVNFYKDYNADVDRAVAKRMLAIFRENVDCLPSFYTEIIDAEFGGDIDAYVDYVYDNSRVTSLDKALDMIENDKEAVKEDPAYKMFASAYALYDELRGRVAPLREKYSEGHRLYIAGLMKMQPERAWASDANFTIRLTYGQVLPYNPADGITYKHYTTLDGVIAKEDPEHPVEFTVPARLKELYAARDYGRYADRNGKLPVGFLANCDITGGNSGSPVLNAKGQLIGLAFDGNWEAMSGDVAFEPELQRTIAVDIRYVLFVIDKFAGATWLLDELTIK
ncbi:MAG: S46 family peptidase [Alistipes sp.]|nr:S46 family peptidase [Alistipes sp.]